MKKAYVKPVFLAEAFEVTTNVAACKTRSNAPHEIWKGDPCSCGAPGHAVDKTGGAPVDQYWDYASNGNKNNYNRGEMGANNGSYIFTDDLLTCDFVWNERGGMVGVWKDKETNNLVSDLTQRFFGEEGTNKGSFVDYIGSSFMAFFRKNEPGCEPYVDEGVPFS